MAKWNDDNTQDYSTERDMPHVVLVRYKNCWGTWYYGACTYHVDKFTGEQVYTCSNKNISGWTQGSNPASVVSCAGYVWTSKRRAEKHAHYILTGCKE